MNDTEKKEWWKTKYSDSELELFGKDKLIEMMLKMPKGSEEREQVSRVYTIMHVKENRGWDTTRVEETPVKSKSSEETIIEGKPIPNVRRITCVYHGTGKKGWDECLIASSDGDFNAKHVDVIGLKPKTVTKMGISPKGMVMETQPFNAYLAGNAILDYGFRETFERGNVGNIMTVRDLMGKMDKADLLSLHRFDWSERKVPEKIKELFRHKKRN